MRISRVACVVSVLLAWTASACEDDPADTQGGAGSTAAGAGMGGSAPGMAGAASGGTMAVAAIAPFGMGNTVTGTATFVQSGADVTVTVSLSNCPDGAHSVHIHQGTTCDTAEAQGGHWDMTRGEGIPNVMCTGGTGTATVTRMPADPTLAWSIGGAATTNVVGHAFVVHNPPPNMTDPAPRIGCGLIK